MAPVAPFQSMDGPWSCSACMQDGCLQVLPCGIARPDAGSPASSAQQTPPYALAAGDTTTDVAAVADDQGRASGFRLDVRRSRWLLCRG